MNYGEALKSGAEYLRSRDIADAEYDAWYLLEFAGHISRAEYLLRRTEKMPKEVYIRYEELLRERGKRIPLQHLTGEQEFMGLSFTVNDRVLIPRQDTELLAEEALKRLRPGARVLDLCTGSGCIAISLKKIRADLDVTASDLSGQALEIARENAKRLMTDIDFVQSDLLEELSGTFDMIVSNPPYIPTKTIDTLMEEVRFHDPKMALDGGADGLFFYRRIIAESKSHLTLGGWLIFEIGHDQGETVSHMMMEGSYTGVRVIKDLSGLDRVVVGTWHKEEL